MRSQDVPRLRGNEVIHGKNPQTRDDVRNGGEWMCANSFARQGYALTLETIVTTIWAGP